MLNKFFFKKNHAVYEIMWKKYGTVGQATDDNMAHTHFMLYTLGYKHTLLICNANCFSTATMTMRICLNVTLYVHCQSCQSRVFTAVFPILQSTENCGLFGSLEDNKHFAARLHDQLCHFPFCSFVHGRFVSPNSQRLHSKILKEGVARKYRGKKALHRSASHYTDIKAIKKKNRTHA